MRYDLKKLEQSIQKQCALAEANRQKTVVFHAMCLTNWKLLSKLSGSEKEEFCLSTFGSEKMDKELTKMINLGEWLSDRGFETSVILEAPIMVRSTKHGGRYWSRVTKEYAEIMKFHCNKSNAKQELEEFEMPSGEILASTERIDHGTSAVANKLVGAWYVEADLKNTEPWPFQSV